VIERTAADVDVADARVIGHEGLAVGGARAEGDQGLSCQRVRGQASGRVGGHLVVDDEVEPVGEAAAAHVVVGVVQGPVAGADEAERRGCFQPVSDGGWGIAAEVEQEAVEPRLPEDGVGPAGGRLGDGLGGRVQADGPVVEGESAGSVVGAVVLPEVAAGVAGGFAGPVRAEGDVPGVAHGAVAPAPVEDLVAGVVVPPDEVVGQASLEVGHLGGRLDGVELVVGDDHPGVLEG
jgi:hypothetical protein